MPCAIFGRVRKGFELKSSVKRNCMSKILLRYYHKSAPRGVIECLNLYMLLLLLEVCDIAR